MKTVSESIWSNGGYIIPMAEVSHIENLLDSYSKEHNQIRIIFKYSKWDDAESSYHPSICLIDNMAESFKKDWCYYRAEFENLLKV